MVFSVEEMETIKAFPGPLSRSVALRVMYNNILNITSRLPPACVECKMENT